MKKEESISIHKVARDIEIQKIEREPKMIPREESIYSSSGYIINKESISIYEVKREIKYEGQGREEAKKAKNQSLCASCHPNTRKIQSLSHDIFVITEESSESSESSFGSLNDRWSNSKNDTSIGDMIIGAVRRETSA
jgi:hypothetical protein